MRGTIILLLLLFFAVDICVGASKKEKLEHFCTYPQAPGCHLDTYTPATVDEPATCKIKCQVNLGSEESKDFCREQSPYPLTKFDLMNKDLTCTFQALVQCEDDGNNQFVGRCIKYHKEPKTFIEAEKICKTENSKLFLPQSRLQKDWLLLSASINNVFVWVGDSGNYKAMRMSSTDDMTAGEIVTFDEHRQLAFYCMPQLVTSLRQKKFLCESLKTLNLLAVWNDNACTVQTSSAYSAMEYASSSEKLKSICEGISPMTARPATPIQETELKNIQLLIKTHGTRRIMFPSRKYTHAGDYHKVCSTDQWTGIEGYLIQEKKSEFFPLPFYAFAPKNFYPQCPTETTISIGSFSLEGIVPTSTRFEMPAACVIDPEMKNVVLPDCEPGWSGFRRSSGYIWCLKYVPGKGVWNEAVAACNQVGAKVAGFENEQEYQFFLAVATQEAISRGQPGSFWIGGRRKPECKYSNWRETRVGCRREEQFEWVDGSTKGTFAFTHWSDGEPNNYKSDEPCLTMYIEPNGPRHGKMNDLFEIGGGGGLLTIVGRMCGKRGHVVW